MHRATQPVHWKRCTSDTISLELFIEIYRWSLIQCHLTHKSGCWNIPVSNKRKQIIYWICKHHLFRLFDSFAVHKKKYQFQIPMEWTTYTECNGCAWLITRISIDYACQKWQAQLFPHLIAGVSVFRMFVGFAIFHLNFLLLFHMQKYECNKFATCQGTNVWQIERVFRLSSKITGFSQSLRARSLSLCLCFSLSLFRPPSITMYWRMCIVHTMHTVRRQRCERNTNKNYRGRFEACNSISTVLVITISTLFFCWLDFSLDFSCCNSHYSNASAMRWLCKHQGRKKRKKKKIER